MYAKPELMLAGGTFAVVRGQDVDPNDADHYNNAGAGIWTSDNQQSGDGDL